MTQKKALNVFMLAMINVAAICNLANVSISAKYGLAAIFFLLIASLFFFIPVSLVSAELATGWPQRGGVYIWVREALGQKLGFLAIWLQWIENVIWYPTALSFLASAFAYVFNPELAQNKIYIISCILTVFWLSTFMNMFGMTFSGWISTICVLIGTIIPSIVIITLGIFYFALGMPPHITFSLKNLMPTESTVAEFSLLAGVFMSLGGMEMSAVHAGEVRNPRKNYPIAIFFSLIVILSIFSLGAISIATVIPLEDINLPEGAIQALAGFFKIFDLSNLTPLIAFLVTLGSLGTISTWTVGPVKGIYSTGIHGELPPFLQKTNKKGVPVTLLIIQAIIVSILSFMFYLMPNITSSYWILLILSAQLYLIMYILMFISAIVLRYTKPSVKRTFKIPFNNTGMVIVAIIGILGASFAIVMSFFPPIQIQAINSFIFRSFLILGIIVFSIIPFIIHHFKDPKWLEYAKKHDKIKEE